MRRRDFLALTGLLAGLALTGCGGAEGNAGTLRFRNPLRIPPLLDPAPDADGVTRFALELREGRTEFLPGKPARTWGVNGDYLGPTLRARRGDRVAMAVTNTLDEPTTLHWHGMRLPARMDGGPHQTVRPGETWRPEWTVDQPAATTWYHPHPHGETSRHVYRGLAGMFILDDEPVALPSVYGTDDVPLIIQDKKIDENGGLEEDFGGTWGLLGDQILVNGTYDPHFRVTTTRVRFRVLNAANAHVFHLDLADDRTFHVVASDAGLLPKPVALHRLQISPGERFEIVVAFEPGEQVVLKAFSGEETIDSGDYDILKLVAAARLTPSAPLPRDLVALAPPARTDRVRRFELGGSNINGQNMDMNRIDEVVPAGAREIWELDNKTYEHNFHIHEVRFRVLDIDGTVPPEHLRGPKDTVFVPDGARVRLAVEFGHHTDQKTPYMYHCHILKHEDNGMMGQFVIVEPGTEGDVPHRPTTTGHGH